MTLPEEMNNMKQDHSLDAYWDDFYEGVPDWDGPTHSRALPSGKGPIAWRPLQCRHWREPVELQDGVTVFASAWFDRPGKQPVDLDWPDVGFYLDGSWASLTLMCSPGFRPRFARYRPAKLLVYPWPDLGVPKEPARFKRALQWLLHQANDGKRLEIGCAGGHGRTGTTLAGLLIMQGLSQSRAVQKIRREYCDEAIETRSQMQMLRRL
jgi:rhodanese/phosphatase family protein